MTPETLAIIAGAVMVGFMYMVLLGVFKKEETHSKKKTTILNDVETNILEAYAGKTWLDITDIVAENNKREVLKKSKRKCKRKTKQKGKTK